jgi:hypothetical protein
MVFAEGYSYKQGAGRDFGFLPATEASVCLADLLVAEHPIDQEMCCMRCGRIVHVTFLE